MSIKSAGCVGDLAWVFTSSGQVPGNATQSIQPGHYAADFNGSFSSFSLPKPTNAWQSTWANVATDPVNTTNIIRIGGTWTNSNGTWSLIGGVNCTNIGTGWTIDGVIYHLVITNRLQNTNWVYYSMSQLSQNIFIDAPRVVLYLTNGMPGSGRYSFTLNTNADMQLWTTGDINAQGNATINNLNNYARALSFFDVAGNPLGGVLVKLNGDFSESGYYYMPSSVLYFKGGGSAPSDFTGAVICYELSIEGNMNFHYDESLGIALPPGISAQPTNRIVQVNSNATFNVSAGMIPLNYQWFQNQTNPIGFGTGSSLTLTNVQLTDAGNYSVVVNNSYGAVTSLVAGLIVFTNATATMSAPLITTNGQFQFNISGVSGLNYAVQTSTNLVDWIPLGTNVSPFTFADTNSALFPQRFYRSVYFP